MSSAIIHHAAAGDPLPCRLARHQRRENAILAFCGRRHFHCQRCDRIVLQRWFPRKQAGQHRGAGQ